MLFALLSVIGTYKRVFTIVFSLWMDRGYLGKILMFLHILVSTQVETHVTRAFDFCDMMMNCGLIDLGFSGSRAMVKCGHNWTMINSSTASFYG